MPKFTRERHTFVCDFVVAIKIYQLNLFTIYIDPTTSFKALHFQGFCDLIDIHICHIYEEWVIDLTTLVE